MKLFKKYPTITICRIYFLCFSYQGSSGGITFITPIHSTITFPSIAMRNHMSKFPCKRTLPTKKMGLMNNGTTNTRTISKEKEITMSLSYTKCIFAKRCRIDIILNLHSHFDPLFYNVYNCNPLHYWNIDRYFDNHSCFHVNHSSNRDSNHIKM